MLYQSFLPSPPLQDFVRNYTLIQFHFRSDRPTPPKQRSPKPEEKITFYIRGGVCLTDPKTGRIDKPPAIAIYGHQRDAKILKVTPEFDTLVVYLRPGILYKLIQQSAIILAGNYCDAELFFGNTVRNVNEQLMATNDSSTRIQIVEQFLLTKCLKLREKNPVDRVADFLLSDPASFSLDKLANDACLSSKQFYRRFNEQIGMNPKLYSRLSRFNHAYRYKLANPHVSWSSVAQQFRYTDYHHLEKEFKEFAGQTPAEWLLTHMSSPERMLKLR